MWGGGGGRGVDWEKVGLAGVKQVLQNLCCQMSVQPVSHVEAEAEQLGFSGDGRAMGFF